MFKRILCLCLALPLALSAAACSAAPAAASATPAPTPVPTAASTPVPAQETAPSPVPTAPMPSVPYEQQRAILENSRAVWGGEDVYYDTWYYTFTDLDNNGRMEVMTASTQGSGIFTFAKVWEISPDYSGVSRCPDREDEEFVTFPEIVVNTISYYTDPASGQRWYVCEDLTRDGAAHYYNSWVAFSLNHGRIETRVLAAKSTEYTSAEGDVSIACQDAAGNPISERDYDTAPARAFAGWPLSTLSFDWIRVEFSAWAEPSGNEYASAYAGPAPTITKNPTSEALTIGGKTWFIAHADNADTLTWELLRPDGMIFSLSEAMAANPGLVLEALEGDTIAVSNVPLSVNGWGVRARFEGPGGAAVTEPAYLYVGDYLTAYASVLDNYRAVFANGRPDYSLGLQQDLGDALSSSVHVGYAFKDLDKDGTPELIVAGIENDPFVEKMVYGLYTLENGAPKRLFVSNARDRWYLLTDSTLLNEGSGGAGHSGVTLFRLQNGALAGLETVFTFFDGTSSDGYYYRPGAYTYDIQPGDRLLSAEEFDAARQRWESAAFLPPLTRLA